MQRTTKPKPNRYKDLKKFTRGDIMGLTKRLNAHRFGKSCDRSAMWDSLFKDAEDTGLEIGYDDLNGYGERLDFTKPRKITAEQTKFGKAWLKNYFFKLNGAPRSGKRTEYVAPCVLDMAKKITRFEFIGIMVCASQGWYPNQSIPIYRAYTSKGESFDYAPIRWGQPLTNGGN